MKMTLLLMVLLAVGLVTAQNHTNETMDDDLANVTTDTPEGIEEGWAETIQDSDYYLNFNDTVGDSEDIRRTTTGSFESTQVRLLTSPDPNMSISQGAQAIDYDGDGIGTIVIMMFQGGARPATASEINQLDLENI